MKKTVDETVVEIQAAVLADAIATIGQAIDEDSVEILEKAVEHIETLLDPDDPENSEGDEAMILIRGWLVKAAMRDTPPDDEYLS